MDVVAWLEHFAKLDELIEAKKAERERVREAAYNTVGNMDGMPHAPGVADKVGSLAVKLAAAEEEISRYAEEKRRRIRILEMLPAAEYGVLHREYVRGLKQRQIAYEMGYSTVQVWRIGKRAKRRLAEILAGAELPQNERG